MSDKVRSPNGEYLPAIESLSQWEDLARPLKSLGFEVHGYDPGISFYSQNSKKLSVFTIAVGDLRIINDALKN
jgi:hypothetical protein